MNFKKIIELMKGLHGVSNEDSKQTLLNILSSNLHLTNLDVESFRAFILETFLNLHVSIDGNSEDYEGDSELYKNLMIENLHKFLVSQPEEKLPLNIELINEQDLAVLFLAAIQDFKDTTTHVDKAFKEISKKIVCQINPIFDLRAQELIMRFINDPIADEIPKTPYLYQSVSVSTLNPGPSLMIDKTTMDGMLRSYQESRDNLKIIEEQLSSLAFILSQKLLDSEPNSLDHVLDTALLQLDQQLPSGLSEPMYNMFWQQLNQLDRAIEHFTAMVYSEISMELQRYSQVLERRRGLENLDRQIIFQISEEDDDRLASIILQHEDLTEILQVVPSLDSLSHEIERLQALLRDENILLDTIMSNPHLPLNNHLVLKELDYEQRKCLCRGVITSLKDKEWILSDENQGLFYSHYQRRYYEQTGLFDEHKCSLVVTSHGETHELKGLELKHPLDKNCFLQNPERCDAFLELLIACAINGDIAAFKRRKYIRQAIDRGEYTQSADTTQQLEFFEKVDEFLSSKEDYYLECLENMYIHFSHDNHEFAELVETRTESQARFLSDLWAGKSPATDRRPLFRMIYNNLDSDSGIDYYDGVQESKGPSF